MAKVPERLVALEDLGIIDGVIRPLMSGKEADVYLVDSRGEQRVAKVYKEATNRSFQNRADYTEGRRVRNSRQARAMQKRSRYGKAEIEAAWRSAEVDAIFQLKEAGVAVPEPYDFVEGVLVMELVRGWDGGPAPRLVDIEFERDEARAMHTILLNEVVKMLCAGVIHGDLSDFNVLISPERPVVIDFPQWIDPASNRNARKLLIRDVDNLTQFLARFDQSLNGTRYGPEIWSLYEAGRLKPGAKLTGRHKGSSRQANVGRIVDEIQAAEKDHRRRMGEDVDEEGADDNSGGRPKARHQKRSSAAEEFFAGLEWRGSADANKGRAAKVADEPLQLPKERPKQRATRPSEGPRSDATAGSGGSPKKRRRRRKSGGSGGGGGGGGGGGPKGASTSGGGDR